MQRTIMLDSTFSRLHDVAENTLFYLHSFSSFCQICKIPREFELIAGQGHPRSLILVSIESAYATSILVINSNFVRILYRFRDIDAFARK